MATPIRNIRISDEDWEALGRYAEDVGMDRTAVLRMWIHDLVPPRCWPQPEQAEGQMRLL